MKKHRKAAIFTDIHWGKKGNSESHNQDCTNFIKWMISEIKTMGDIDYIAFLGDWHENRNAINIETLKYSFNGAKLLDNLNIPIYFIVGNHDLYHRHSRDTHSLVHFDELTNFKLIDQPTVVDDIEGGVMFSPFLFSDEYPDLNQFNNIPVWMGHFEFKGFIVTGYNVIMPTGPDIKDFQGPKDILSGHFHKRQSSANVHYVGNVFPMDFGDAGDYNRGFVVYDHTKNTKEYHDWPDCPKYTKTTLSELLDERVSLYPDSHVKCIVDMPISYEESIILKQTYTETYNLREFAMEESSALSEAVSGTETKIQVGDDDLTSVNDLVMQMLDDIDNKKINNDVLKNEYKKLT